MAPASVVSAGVEAFGFEAVPDVLTPHEVGELIDVLGNATGPGRRGVLGIPAVARLACSTRLLDPARACLRAKPHPVRAIYFDKTATTNWAVAWHQDRTIAVRAHAEVSGFGPWSVKDGVPHVQPPTGILEQMITIRIHLDDCNADNGALRVLPGSHTRGRLTAGQVRRMTQQQEAIVCNVPAGGAMFMRPLLVHSSRRSAGNGHRRVLHIEYAGVDLPAPLEWLEAACGLKREQNGPAASAPPPEWSASPSVLPTAQSRPCKSRNSLKSDVACPVIGRSQNNDRGCSTNRLADSTS